MGGDGVLRVPKRDVDPYLSWATEMENFMSFKRCWSAINPRELTLESPADSCHEYHRLCFLR